jgi:hypothetical protein
VRKKTELVELMQAIDCQLMCPYCRQAKKIAHCAVIGLFNLSDDENIYFLFIYILTIAEKLS